MKKTKGFTLVELIVVIAIIGVLAAILVPAMMGWITKANMRNANSGAKEIYNFGQALAAELEDTYFSVDEYKRGIAPPLFAPSTYDGVIYSEDSNPICDDAHGGLGSSGNTFQKEIKRRVADKKGAEWAIKYEVTDTDDSDVGTVIASIYSAKGPNDHKYVGTYPPFEKNTKKYFGNKDIGTMFGEIPVT